MINHEEKQIFNCKRSPESILRTVLGSNLWRRWFCVGWLCDIWVWHILRWIAEFIFGFYLFIFAIFSLFTTRSWIWFMHCGKSCFSRTIQKPIINFLTVEFFVQNKLDFLNNRWVREFRLCEPNYFNIGDKLWRRKFPANYMLVTRLSYWWQIWPFRLPTSSTCHQHHDVTVVVQNLENFLLAIFDHKWSNC